jgi:hypothetical protein
VNEKTFRNLLLELVEENPLAIRAVLKILDVEFSGEVPSLCVTCEERPRLVVNLDFINQNCRSDAEVKAVICHEFLHILLRHTEKRNRITEAEHLATDAVINAIIHRQLGPEYSALMAHYYQKAPGLIQLLRPMSAEEADQIKYKIHADTTPQWIRAWKGLYEGTLVVDDIKELAEEFDRSRGDNRVTMILPSLLGNHAELGEPLPRVLEDALDQTMKVMNGGGIWRSPRSRGIGAMACDTLFTSADTRLESWIRSTRSILIKHLVPDKKAQPTRLDHFEYVLPVLSPQDRRAFFRSLWIPYIPEACWSAHRNQPGGLAQVYLDVSGSMDAEMPYIITLLRRLRPYIRMPFWAFSDEVTPARIEAGRLITRTTGGTSMSCALKHIAETNPPSAVIITDGYIEPLEREEVRQIHGTRLHAIVSRAGNPAILARAGIDYSQLERIPT